MFNPRRIWQAFKSMIRRTGPLVAGFLALAAVAKWIAYDGGVSTRAWALLLVGELVAVGVILRLVRDMAARFVRALYALETQGQAREFLLRSLFGMSSFQPYAVVHEGAVTQDTNSVLAKVGGPGNLVVYRDSSVVLERAGRLTRVEGPSFVQLEAFEKLYAVVDLRPQRWVYKVSAMSKEGIKVTCPAEIIFQLDSGGGEAPAGSTGTQPYPPDLASTLRLPDLAGDPFPMNPDNVFKAATCTWVREANRPTESRVMDWAGRVVISETEGTLRSILARYPLDQLVGQLPMESKLAQKVWPVNTQGQHAREAIREELEQTLRQNVVKLGARILSVGLGQIQVDDKVAQQWLENVNAEAENWARRHLAEGETEIVMKEKQSEAIHSYLHHVGNIFVALGAQGQVPSHEIILARMFEVLEQVSADPLTRSYMPGETLKTLKALGEIIARALPPADSADAPGDTTGDSPLLLPGGTSQDAPAGDQQ